MGSEKYSEFKIEKGLVSIVVPIYNVEQYLDRCIESIVNQTYRNLEIILVDDGSTDNSPHICDEWAARDSRIKVFHKKNEGAGIARNLGIEHLKGEYVCFFDSDDYAALDVIEKAYCCICSYHADVVHYGSYQVGMNGKIIDCNTLQTDKTLYEGDEIKSYILPNMISPDPNTGKMSKLAMSPWRCMFSMEVIKKSHWRFVSEREYLSEDSYSFLVLYKDVERVAIIPDALYFHCENETSITNTYRQDKYEKIKSWYDACIKICHEFEYGEEAERRMKVRFINMTVRTMKFIARTDLDKREQKEEINSIIEDPKLHEIIKNMNLKHENKQRRAVLYAIKYRRYGLARLLIFAKGQKFKFMRNIEIRF